ncbi:hypothetical protein [Gordonia asplenii]|uniref:hypothetical protein n=1 Tax=Gordonia asplenii TaxID=2725283 RepID=UPI001FE5047D|nr:hypothetical protein [Gordonia asplenii]
MNIVAMAWVVVLIGSVLVRGSSKPGRAPDSAAYTEYRGRLRRNLLIAAAFPVVGYVGMFVGGAAEIAVDGFATPAALDRVLTWFIVPGVYLLPLLALCITEYTNRSARTGVASLVPRTVGNYSPAWLLAIAGAITIVGLAVPLMTLSDGFGRRHTFTAPRIEVSVGAVDGLILEAGYLLIALMLTVLTIRQAVQRPDLDATTSSDTWSRSGVVARALALLILAALLPVTEAIYAVDTLAGAYRSYLDGGGDPMSQFEWLQRLNVKAYSGWLGALCGLAALLALGLFAFPPRLAESAPASNVATA